MKKSIVVAMVLVFAIASVAEAQQERRGKRRNQDQSGQKRGIPGRSSPTNQIVENPLAIGDSGVAWYTTWGTAVTEAQRSNRPILFTSAATTCSGVPGVF